MNEKDQDKMESNLTANEYKPQLPSLPSKDQQKFDQLQKSGKRSLPKWTGFSGKTLWDLLQLLGILAIPIVVVLVSVAFSFQQEASNQQQHQVDLQIAHDQQQETILKTYLDDMTDLLLNRHLYTSAPGDEVRVAAKERILTTLRQLDAKRNKFAVQFLQDAKLIDRDRPIVDLRFGDMSGDDLSATNLSQAFLYWVDLSGANLSQAFLNGSNLSQADLSGANLIETRMLCNGFKLDGKIKLSCVDLDNANLQGANLQGALIEGVDLHDANLQGADLRGALLIQGCINQSGGIRICTNLKGAKYNTKTIQATDFQGKTITDVLGNPVMIAPTQWPQGFDPKIARATCVDC